MAPSQASCVRAADRRGWGWGTQSSLVLLHAEKLPFPTTAPTQEDPTAQCPGFLLSGDVHHWGLSNDALPVP